MNGALRCGWIALSANIEHFINDCMRSEANVQRAIVFFRRELPCLRGTLEVALKKQKVAR